MDDINELDLYDVNCDNINEILLKKENIAKETIPVNVINDEKYRHLRSIIVQQKKIILQQADQIAVLKSTAN
jgi:hypothetical protein